MIKTQLERWIKMENMVLLNNSNDINIDKTLNFEENRNRNEFTNVVSKVHPLLACIVIIGISVCTSEVIGTIFLFLFPLLTAKLLPVTKFVKSRLFKLSYIEMTL